MLYMIDEGKFNGRPFSYSRQVLLDALPLSLDIPIEDDNELIKPTAVFSFKTWPDKKNATSKHLDLQHF